MIKAVLTGHSRGLGQALARELVGRGVAVLGIARQATGRLPGVQEVALDLADLPGLESWLASGALADFYADARQALLINNAGCLQPMGRAGGLASGDMAGALAVNVGAPLLLSNAFLRDVRAGDRRLLHVSSGAARQAYAGWSVYCASKAALDRHAESLALEGHAGLRVASVAPGVIDTDMQGEIRAADPAGFPLQARFVALKANGQLTQPADAARRLIDCLLGPRFGERVLADLRED